MTSYRQVLRAASVLMSGVAAVAPTTVNAEGGPEIDEVIVTARRTEERVQDVSISMSVFDQQQLDDRNVKNAADLAIYTPSLTANTRYGQNSATFSIRGFFQELRTTASVATYFADVVAPRAPGTISSAGDGGGPGSFFDLQNVQVLKGPQGTLFGRNTTGGAILLVPQKPTSEFDGYMEASGGNYDMHRAQGVVNIPFSENVRFRAGFDWQEREGYLKNLTTTGPSDFNDVNYIAGRASLVWDISANVENYTIGSYAKSDTNGVQSHIESCPPAAFAAFCGAQRAREVGSDIYDVSNNIPDAHQESEIWSLINTTTWSASDNLTLKNIISYAQVVADDDINPYGTDFRYTGNDFAPGATAAVAGRSWAYAQVRSIPGGHSADQSTFSEELQLQGNNFDSRLTWQAGAYYENSRPLSPVGTFGPQGSLICDDIDAFQCRDPLGAIFRSAIPAQYQMQETEYTNVGLYSQGTYDLTDKLSLTAGVRYTWDKTESDVRKYLVYFPTPNNAAVSCETPGLAGYSAAPGVYPLTVSAIGTSACFEQLSKDSSAPTWTVGLDYKPWNDLLLYAKYSRGYRQGSTSPLSISGGPGTSISTFDPEQVDVYEIGEKLSWQGAVPGFANLSVFYNDFTDQQILASVDPVGVNLISNVAIINAGSSTIQGAEFEAGITVFDDLHFNASYAYLDSEIKSLTVPPVAPSIIVTPTTAVGRPLTMTPENKYTVSARYDLPLPETIGRVSFGATYVFVDEQWFSQRFFYPTTPPAYRAQAEVDLAPSYELLNVNLNWVGVMGTQIDVSVFGTNVLDEEYIIKIDDNINRGFVGRTYGEPGMWGVKVRYNFGS